MEGQIGEHPFAELTTEILQKRFSGALRVERERVRAVVYFENGDLIYASANLRNLRLTEYLKKRGVEIEKLSGIDSSSDSAIASSLIARGTVTQSTLAEVTTEQVSDVVRVLLLWPDGKWMFDERARLTEPLRAQLPINQLLLAAARRIDLRFTASRFPNGSEVISRGSADASNLNLTAAEGFILSRVEEPIEIEQLVTLSGLPKPEVVRTMYGLVLAGLLDRQSWPYAFRTGPALRKEQPPKTAPPKAVKVEPQTAKDSEAELANFLDRIAEAGNHYEVLNISTIADPSEIKNAYYALARRFHPDRFHELATTALHSRLESAFARITQAHEMLSNPDTKVTYDAKLAALKDAGRVSARSANTAPRSADPQSSGNAGNLEVAELRFQEGVAALALREINTATAALSAAARLAPNQSRYRAYYGRALAAHPQTKRLAEAELQAAVKLEPANASYRVMLATLYRDLGFWRRAINEVERALSLDSKNAEARKLLQNLEAKK